MSLLVDIAQPTCFETIRELQTAVDIYISSGNDRTTNAFSNISNTYGYPIGNWCVSKIIDFGELFSSNRNPDAKYFDEDISTWDTSNIVNMVETFAGATSFNQNLSLWDVSNVQSMSKMFAGASNFEGIGLEMWDVSNVTTMNGCFIDAASFNCDLSKWNVSRVTKTSYMFQNAISFEGKGLSSWDVSSVSDMNGMFWNATLFNEDISAWNVKSVLGFENTFRNASSFNQNISLWNVSAVFRMSSMFRNAKQFNQNLCSWGTLLCDCSTVDAMFNGTSCPYQESPSFNNTSSLSEAGQPLGPFCFDCTMTTKNDTSISLPPDDSQQSTVNPTSSKITIPSPLQNDTSKSSSVRPFSNINDVFLFPILAGLLCVGSCLHII